MPRHIKTAALAGQQEDADAKDRGRTHHLPELYHHGPKILARPCVRRFAREQSEDEGGGARRTCGHHRPAGVA